MEIPLETKRISVCLILFVLNLAAAIEIPLTVQQLPTITTQPTDQVAFPFDDEFSIKCEAKGNPPAIFNWTKDGKPFSLLGDSRITTFNNSGTFVVKNRGNIAFFQGKYRCYASNELGTSMSEEIELIVPGIPKFPKEKIDPIDVEHGDAMVLRCNPPKGIPPLHIYWMNIDLQHIPQDERVSMGLNGDLYFANVDENDSRSDYCCFAAFPKLRTIVQKMSMTLTVTRLKYTNDSSSSNAAKANLIKERKPKLLIPESSGASSEVTFMKGMDLFLECIAEGLPTPHLTWRRINKTSIFRGVAENFGKVLKIEQVTKDDEGTYECVASNDLGETKHEFKVRVEEPPTWVNKPKSGVFSVGGSFVLLCEAIGFPEPTIKWKKNGIPLEDNEIKSNRAAFSTREISIIDLELSDTAVYQCEATNKHGTILATANIDVLNIPPEILTPDGEEYVAVVGYSSHLYCQFFAIPTPDISWTKDDSMQLLEVDQNGTLEIRETRKEDAGFYTCLVKNSVGKRAITATLTVRDATKISIIPKNPQVLKSHSVLLKCHSECDPHLKHQFKISWKKDGEELEMNDTEDGRIIIKRDTLVIQNVGPEDEGVYSCEGTSLLDSATDESRLIVLDVPDPPGDLQLSEKQAKNIRLSWSPGSINNSPINESIVEFEENRWAPGKWQELIRLPGNDTMVVLPLIPYVNYQFRVISVNAVGRSKPSEPSERYETPPAAPDKNPENIRIEASKPHEMNMTWEPLKPMEHNGPGLEYKVNWKQQDTNEWEEETVQKHFLVLQNTPTFVPYDIKVQAVNKYGSGPEPNIVTGYSSEDIPEAAPSNVIVQVLNSSLAKVIWSTIPKDRVRGHLRGYKVNWWKIRNRLDEKNHHPEKHSLTFKADRNDGMVPGLEPFSIYHLTVLAFNSKGNGPESIAYEFQTPEGVPEKPHFLKLLNFEKDSVTLSWGPPKKPNGFIIGYTLQYQMINETDNIGPLHEISITNSSLLSFRLSNLSLSTKYKFYARACTVQGCGKPITEEGVTVNHGSKAVGKITEVKPTPKSQPVEALDPGTANTIRLMTKNWVDNNSISADVIETRGRAYTGIYERISTQGWFIGLMGAVALLTLLLLTICFVKRNKGGKYSVKEKEDLHPDPEGQSIKDEIFGEYSDSDEKPLKGSLRSLNMDIKGAESADSLVDYGEGDHRMFNEDGSFIGAYAGCKEKASVESIGSSTATFPLHA
ncbi:neural cell adhesion molecule L1-like protein [Thamnophis elegans]|uniref:neural cell adhesion molecule L1-like protein n=1 Tax=Thamnophis elegans TaxID=35005 RepID=UPI0013768CEB|nr:neural cell adhesion molecule L1-like protein [Thamnophis elegans]